MANGYKLQELAIAAQKGARVRAFENIPLVPPHLEPIFSAFLTLSRRRPVHMAGVGAIPYAELIAWLDSRQIADADDRDYYLALFERLDIITVRHFNDQADA